MSDKKHTEPCLFCGTVIGADESGPIATIEKHKCESQITCPMSGMIVFEYVSIRVSKKRKESEK